MNVYAPMEWTSVSLAQLAEQVQPRRRPEGASTSEAEDVAKLLWAAEAREPLFWVRRRPTAECRRWADAVVAAAIPGLWLSLALEEGDHEAGSIWMAEGEVRASTVALGGGVALAREERRLRAAGREDLVEVLQHWSRRWTDYRVPLLEDARR